MENLTKRLNNLNVAEFCRMKADEGFIDMLVTKYDQEEGYTPEELKDCWEMSGTDPRKFIACVNSGGDCFIEEFYTRQACMLYLLDLELSLDEIVSFDIQLYKEEGGELKC